MKKQETRSQKGAIANEVSDRSDFYSSVEQIENVVNDIADATQAIRDFAYSKQVEAAGKAKVTDVIKNALKACEARLKREDIDVLIDIQSENLVAAGHSLDLAQALSILIHNACDAIVMKSTSERWIKVVSFEKDGQITIKITDSGAGIPKLVRDKLFLPFFTTKPAGESLGLGLSVAKGVIESNGGRIYLDEDSRNTSFLIVLKTSPL